LLAGGSSTEAESQNEDNLDECWVNG